ncbi:hypothetical protein [Burkholderia gladioli]|uniref:hypothetical protein n=1 Tax=Burkholderia gladioli TaxID=28095 RepID=UPI0012FE2158|nr:hypothetical protein [Burkholderia gladioli]
MADLAKLPDPDTRERSVTIKTSGAPYPAYKLSEKRLLALAIAKCNPKTKMLKIGLCVWIQRPALLLVGPSA